MYGAPEMSRSLDVGGVGRLDNESLTQAMTAPVQSSQGGVPRIGITQANLAYGSSSSCETFLAPWDRRTRGEDL